MASISIESAVTPANIDAIPKLLHEVASAGDSFNRIGNDSLVARLELLAKARELARALETPREVMIQQVWAQVSWQCSDAGPARLNKMLAFECHGHFVWRTHRPVDCHGREW